MKTKKTLINIFLLITFFLSACGSEAVTPESMAHATSDEAVPETAPTEAISNETPTTSETVMESPAWYSASLTDARTGQIFSIESLKGKVVLVETMAVWCSKCLSQQGQVKALHEKLGQRDDFVSIGLDIDPNEDTALLKGYVETQSFDWLYAVPSADISREIASLYGNQFLNPPSTPMLLIDRHGEAHPLPFGIKSADDLLQFIQPFLDESM